MTRVQSRRSFSLDTATLVGCVTLVAALATGQQTPCVGDCNADGRVTIDEVVTGVNIALLNLALERCPSFDVSHESVVTVDELITAVDNALDDCAPPAPSATPTSTRTPTPTPACGNGVTDAREECDDGNRADGDGCSASCLLEPRGDVCTGIPTGSGVRLDTRLVAAGLSSPLYVTAPPRDVSRIFIVEQTGRIRVVKWGELLATPFLDVTARISCCVERGLLSMAFHPDYARNGQFFVDYTDVDGNTVVSRFRVSGDPDVADANSEQVILRQQQPFPNHNGGLVVFGPDRYLYIGFGDGGSAGDPRDNAQNRRTWLGKLLRINVDGGVPYAIPADNPFVGTDNALDEIWALGLRNPWRFSFDRATHDLYIADVGQNLYEEIDVQPAGSGGANYGWRFMEGLHCFRPRTDCPMAGLTVPVVEYSHDQGCSVTGGFVYRGCTMPDLRSTYFYADFCTGFVRSFIYTGGAATNTRDWTADLSPGGAQPTWQISSFGEDARGELYICDLRGAVYKIVPQPN